MTDEKKKPEEDEVTDEQLEDAAGGFLERFPNVPLKEEPQVDKDIPPGDMGSGGEDR
jgi:hypothetical protein